MAKWIDDIVQDRATQEAEDHADLAMWLAPQIEGAAIDLAERVKLAVTRQSVYTLGMAAFVAGLQFMWRSGYYSREALNNVLDAYEQDRKRHQCTRH